MSLWANTAGDFRPQCYTTRRSMRFSLLDEGQKLHSLDISVGNIVIYSCVVVQTAK